MNITSNNEHHMNKVASYLYPPSQSSLSPLHHWHRRMSPASSSSFCVPPFSRLLLPSLPQQGGTPPPAAS